MVINHQNRHKAGTRDTRRQKSPCPPEMDERKQNDQNEAERGQHFGTTSESCNHFGMTFKKNVVILGWQNKNVIILGLHLLYYSPMSSFWDYSAVRYSFILTDAGRPSFCWVRRLGDGHSKDELLSGARGGNPAWVEVSTPLHSYQMTAY